MNQPTVIKQFTETQSLEIKSTHYDTGPLVNLIQKAESVIFQFSMRPDQARAMAAALIEHADALEA